MTHTMTTRILYRIAMAAAYRQGIQWPPYTYRRAVPGYLIHLDGLSAEVTIYHARGELVFRADASTCYVHKASDWLRGARALIPFEE